MRLNLILFLFFFYAQVASADAERLLKIDKSFSNVRGNVQEISDMPAVSSQDSLSICYAHVAATMMQKENCRYNHSRQPDPSKRIPCSSLPEQEIFSPLDLARLQVKNDSEISGVRSNYKDLHIEGGSLIDAIRFGALIVKQSANQACVSLDRILEKLNDRAPVKDAQEAMWRRLKTQFDEVKRREAGLKGCDSCLDNLYATALDEISPMLQQDLNIKTSKVQQSKAFAAARYSEFLNQFLGTAHCIRPTQIAKFDAHDAVTYVHFPKEKGQQTTPSEVISKIQGVLAQGRPVALSSICYAETVPSKCPKDKYHAVVVAGYREVCTITQPEKCRKSFKVINSWGKQWQNDNDDGWIDADTVLAHTDMGPGVISWFEDKK